MEGCCPLSLLNRMRAGGTRVLCLARNTLPYPPHPMHASTPNHSPGSSSTPCISFRLLSPFVTRVRDASRSKGRPPDLVLWLWWVAAAACCWRSLLGRLLSIISDCVQSSPLFEESLIWRSPVRFLGIDMNHRRGARRIEIDGGYGVTLFGTHTTKRPTEGCEAYLEEQYQQLLSWATELSDGGLITSGQRRGQTLAMTVKRQSFRWERGEMLTDRKRIFDRRNRRGMLDSHQSIPPPGGCSLLMALA